jgi:hypothetical protein
MSFVAGEIKLNNSSIMTFGSVQMTKNSSINIAHANQTGIGLPIEIIILNQIHLRSPYKMPIKHTLTHYSN